MYNKSIKKKSITSTDWNYLPIGLHWKYSVKLCIVQTIRRTWSSSGKFEGIIAYYFCINRVSYIIKYTPGHLPFLRLYFGTCEDSPDISLRERYFRSRPDSIIYKQATDQMVSSTSTSLIGIHVPTVYKEVVLFRLSSILCVSNTHKNLHRAKF